MRRRRLFPAVGNTAAAIVDHICKWIEDEGVFLSYRSLVIKATVSRNTRTELKKHAEAELAYKLKFN